MQPNNSNKAFLEKLIASTQHLITGQVQPFVIRHGGATIGLLEELIEKELVAKDTACRIWGESLGIAYVNPLTSLVTEDAVSLIPREIAEKALVLGLVVIEGVLTLAMATPEDTALIKRIEGIIGGPVSPVFSPPKEVKDAIKLYYIVEGNLQQELAGWQQGLQEAGASLTDDNLEKLIADSTVSRIYDGILFSAIRNRASDIHLEPGDVDARVRFRIDGSLNEMFTCGKAVLRAFLIRSKVLAKLNVSESRFPQDGRFSLPLGMGHADFRFSEIPTMYGNKGVIRILSGSRTEGGFRLEDLSMLPSVQNRFKRLLNTPNGIFLATGPTGSGKTTTLYAALDALNHADVNISTIEDPIEIRLDGVNQSQVHAAIGLKFENLLRSLLRQDPDIILVGEIRDGETARIATQAALTGHLVLSTLHTNTAVQAIVRLIDLGVEPYLVAPAIMGVLAQRLARRICENCKTSYHPDIETLEQYFKDLPSDERIWFSEGKGCSHCRNTGFSGRVALHEIVTVDDEMRSLIARNASQATLQNHARRVGCRSMRYDALKKVLLGMTTTTEIDKLTVLEWE